MTMIKRLMGATALAALMVTAAAAKDATMTIPIGPYKATVTVLPGNDDDYTTVYFVTSKELGNLNASDYSLQVALTTYETIMKKKGFADGWESIDNLGQASGAVAEAKANANGWAVKLKGFGNTVFQVNKAVIPYGSTTPDKTDDLPLPAITFMVLPDGTNFVVAYDSGPFSTGGEGEGD